MSLSLNPPPMREPFDKNCGEASDSWMRWVQALYRMLLSLVGANGGDNLQFAFGEFRSVVNQTAAAATATAVTLGTTVFSNGVTNGSPSSRIIFAAAGYYNVQFGLQLANSAAADDDFTLWFRINGVDVANSGYVQSVPSKHGAIDGHDVLSANFLFKMAAGDYLEMIWTTDSGTSYIVNYNSGTGPVHPASSSVVVTAEFVSAL